MIFQLSGEIGWTWYSESSGESTKTGEAGETSNGSGERGEFVISSRMINQFEIFL